MSLHKIQKLSCINNLENITPNDFQSITVEWLINLVISIQGHQHLKCVGDLELSQFSDKVGRFLFPLLFKVILISSVDQPGL